MKTKICPRSLNLPFCQVIPSMNHLQDHCNGYPNEYISFIHADFAAAQGLALHMLAEKPEGQRYMYTHCTPYVRYMLTVRSAELHSAVRNATFWCPWFVSEAFGVYSGLVHNTYMLRM